MKESFLDALAEEIATLAVHPSIIFRISNIVQRVLDEYDLDYNFEQKVDEIFVDESEHNREDA